MTTRIPNKRSRASVVALTLVCLSAQACFSPSENTLISEASTSAASTAGPGQTGESSSGTTSVTSLTSGSSGPGTTGTDTTDTTGTGTTSLGATGSSTSVGTTSIDTTSIDTTSVDTTSVDTTTDTTTTDTTTTDTTTTDTTTTDTTTTDTTTTVAMTTTDATGGGGGGDAPYNACMTNVDCGGAHCMNPNNSGLVGNVCAPACMGKPCPPVPANVDASGGAQCRNGYCVLICTVGMDDCGPDSNCEWIQAPTVGMCVHTP
jgi:hypothetical protein